MTNSMRTIFVGAALAGLVAASRVVAAAPGIQGTNGGTTGLTKGKKATKSKKEKHACRGFNSCKGKGGCGATKGKNDCKGKGECRTDGKPMDEHK
jgi:hypothetical protein